MFSWILISTNEPKEHFDGEFIVIDWNYFFSGEYEKPDECE
ncbi:hypothetical protein [Paucisalibacillus globulus]|nr:hypothetical protein [Paucisalibacillus globulus]